MKTRNVSVIACVLFSLLVSAKGFAEQQTYTVQKGDSLYKIGKLFNTTPETLKKLNDLRNDRLDVGQVLKVSAGQPAASAQAVQARRETQNYTVRRGDTLSGIAQSFSVGVNDIIAANNIVNRNRVGIGQILVIPGVNKASDATTVSTAIQSSAQTAIDADNREQTQVLQVRQEPNETRTYTVRMGDAISGIAQSFNISVNDIATANNLGNSNILSVGQVLVIPGQIKTASVTQTSSATNLKPPVNENAGDINTRDRLIEAGYNLLGVRYRYGGTSETTGLDCSALVKNLFEKFGFSLPRSSREQYTQGEKVAKEELQKGDLVFFSSSGKIPSHVGIYIGGNQFLHAASKAKKVVISDLGRTWYDIRYLGARRIVEIWRDDDETPLDDARQETLIASVIEDNASPEGFAVSVASNENQ